MAIHGDNQSKRETGLSGNVVAVRYGASKVVACSNVDASELQDNPLVSALQIEGESELRERVNDWAKTPINEGAEQSGNV